jgi:hypothetical protein
MTNISAKDQKVQQLIQVVAQKKAAIAEANKKPNWETNCSFSFGPDSAANRFNIQTVSDPNILVNALAFLIKEKGALEEANTRLGFDGKFKWQGYSIEQWESDFKTRINKIQITQNQQELDITEAALNKLMSAEMKEELELEEISKRLLGGK